MHIYMLSAQGCYVILSHSQREQYALGADWQELKAGDLSVWQTH